MSDATDGLLFQIKALGLPMPEREARLIPDRRWRWDLAWRTQRLVCEVDGGGFIAGRHSRGSGIEKDAEKQSAAAIEGYRTLRVTPRQIESGQAVAWIEAALAS